jgi:hypothetical protein
MQTHCIAQGLALTVREYCICGMRLSFGMIMGHIGISSVVNKFFVELLHFERNLIVKARKHAAIMVEQ